MKKVIRDGKVAVIYSPGFGAGWLTWDAPKELVFDPQLVEMIENGEQEKIEKHLTKRGYDFYMGGADKLEIEWIPEGTAFKIREYDGSESIEIRDLNNWIIA